MRAEPASAALARDFVRSTLRSGSHRGVEDVAALCVTELVANVISHTGCRDCVVTVLDREAGVTIEVADEATELPSVEPVPPLAERGRGLQIVDSMAAAWGVRRQTPAGKAIWLELSDS